MSSSTLRFAGDWSLSVVVAVTAVAVLAVMALYLRETRTLASPYRWLLPGLRGSAVALVLLILAGPVWHRRQVFGTLGHVTFAVDVSQSMSLSDSTESESSPSRLQRATELLAGDSTRAGWIESLRQTHEIDVVEFSSGSPRTVWSSAQELDELTLGELEATGDSTDLSSVFENPRGIDPETGADSTAPDADPTAIRRATVLLTDGRDTTGRSALDVAQRTAATTSLHTVGIGSEQEPTDVGVMSVVHPDSVASDGRLTGEIVLKHFGLADSTVNLRLEAFAETVWRETVSIDADGRQTIPFDVEIGPIVEDRLAGLSRRVKRNTVVLEMRAMVEPVAGEMTEKNNAFDFRVAASTRERRLLVLDGSSRWEIRYLRNLFERDPRWEVDAVLIGAGTDLAQPAWGDQPGELPATREAMARYDAVVLGEIPVRHFDSAAMFRFTDFVTRGGGLIIIDGRYDRVRELAATELGDLVPVRHLDRERPEVRFVQPTSRGREHPILNLRGRSDDLAAFWRRLPPPVGVVPSVAKEDAEVWGEAIGRDGRRHPWLVTRLFGAGRVFYLAAGQTWRWRYKVADRFHARFWNQLVTAAMPPPYSASDDFVAIGTDRIEYTPGDRARVRARLQDTGGEPIGDATVDALIVSGDQVIATVPLSADDPARGTYDGSTPPLESGRYEVKVRASGFDSAALQASTPIWVASRESAEFERVSLDRDTVAQLAEAGGGVYVHESSAERLLEELKPLSTGRIVESDYVLWQSYYWFTAVLVLLALEWWLRKRAGLV